MLLFYILIYKDFNMKTDVSKVTTLLIISLFLGCSNSSDDDNKTVTNSSSSLLAISSAQNSSSSSLVSVVSSDSSSSSSSSQISNLGNSLNTLGYYGENVYLGDTLIVGSWVKIQSSWPVDRTKYPSLERLGYHLQGSSYRETDANPERFPIIYNFGIDGNGTYHGVAGPAGIPRMTYGVDITATKVTTVDTTSNYNEIYTDIMECSIFQDECCNLTKDGVEQNKALCKLRIVNSSSNQSN